MEKAPTHPNGLYPPQNRLPSTPAAQHLNPVILTPGSRLGHYELTGHLGAGGMGDVWKARDTRLDREVAIKVLPAGTASSPDHRARFNREAKAIAALNHPNIITVYSVEETADVYFITMELISGKTVADLLPKKGFDLKQFLDIAIPLADAVATAHEQGIVHRDLKPGNVMVTDRGRVKVLDFGLAKLTGSGGSSSTATVLTQDGLAMGTLPYMSPEQIEGKSVDHRADIFSLGIVLYEMATGTRPFAGDNQPALIYALFQQTPAPITDFRSDLPAHLDGILNRCLEKSPDLRYQAARDLLNDLHALRQGAAPTTPVARPRTDTSIAVLPFANMSPNPEDDFFSDGITEEIINVLTQLKGLHVAARTSCFAFKGKHEDLRTVGEKLGVKTLLEGSVRKAGSKLRVTAQLVNARDGYHLWSERYDRDFTDVFAIQDEIAGAIADKLRVALTRKEVDSPERRSPRNLEAYELFLKGRVLQARRGEALPESRECFERAVKLDPDLAEAHALLADTYRLYSLYGVGPAKEMMPLSRASARRALAIDPNQVEGLASMACIMAMYDRNFEGALPLWERALAINPLHVRALLDRALITAVLKPVDMPRALHDARKASEVDFLNAWAVGMYALVLAFDNQNELSVEKARHATELDSRNFMARWTLVETLYHAGRHEEGLAAAEPALTMSGRHPYVLTAVAGAHAALGNTAGARAVYDELVSRSGSEYVGPAWLAASAASAGLMDDARRHAIRAVEELDSPLVFWRSLPDWDAFRANPACVEVLEAAGV